MKKRLEIGLMTFLTIIAVNMSSVFAYNGNANLSGGAIILFFIPVMLGIIYLASKGEVK